MDVRRLGDSIQSITLQSAAIEEDKAHQLDTPTSSAWITVQNIYISEKAYVKIYNEQLEP